MKKAMLSIAIGVVMVLLAALGINFFRGSGPRERIKDDEGGRIIVEELSYYRHGDKLYGKLFLPGDENGNFPDSLGSRPVMLIVHDPMKPTAAEALAKSLVNRGLICNVAECPGKSKDIEFLIRKIGQERFCSEGMIFLIADSFSSQNAMEAIIGSGSKTAGFVMIEPKLQGKAALMAKEHASELLVIGAEEKGNAKNLIMEYLEIRGALK